MRSITHRELRNGSAGVLRAVADGESFLVTNNGATVARVSPASETEPDLRVSRPAVLSGGFSALQRVKAPEGSDAVLKDLRGDR